MRKLLYLLLFLSFGAKAQPSAFYHSMLHTVAPPTDTFEAETNQFFDSLTANSVSWTTSQKKIVDTLVRDIKGLTNPAYSTSNVISRIKVLLPIFGGTAYSHSLNLVNAAIYKATMVGSPTHSASGIAFNGTSQYLNTNYAANLLGNLNRNAAIYATGRSAVDNYLWGAFDGSSALFGVRATDNTAVVLGFNNVTLPTSLSYGDFTSLNIESGSRGDFYSNGVSVYNTTPVNTTATFDIYVGALNLGSVFGYKQFDLKFYLISESLTSTEHLNLYNAVFNYQTRLSRP